MPCVQLASYLEGSPLIWMMLLHLHINLNADDDDDRSSLAIQLEITTILQYSWNNFDPSIH